MVGTEGPPYRSECPTAMDGVVPDPEEAVSR